MKIGTVDSKILIIENIIFHRKDYNQIMNIISKNAEPFVCHNDSKYF